MADRTRLSEYFYTLDHESKQRYIQKIAHFNGEDPYWLKKDAFSQLVDDLPDFRSMLHSYARVATLTCILFFTCSALGYCMQGGEGVQKAKKPLNIA